MLERCQPNIYQTLEMYDGQTWEFETFAIIEGDEAAHENELRLVL